MKQKETERGNNPKNRIQINIKIKIQQTSQQLSPRLTPKYDLYPIASEDQPVKAHITHPLYSEVQKLSKEKALDAHQHTSLHCLYC